MEYDPGQTLLQAIADELAKKAADCNPQNVANSVWAFGSFGENDAGHGSSAFGWPCN